MHSMCFRLLDNVVIVNAQNYSLESIEFECILDRWKLYIQYEWLEYAKEIKISAKHFDQYLPLECIDWSIFFK